MLDSQDYGVSFLALDQYMREVLSTPPLTDEEEVELLRRISQGKAKGSPCSLDAHGRLVQGYQRFVLNMAKRYLRYSRELDVMDLVQEGNLGLLQAIANYDVGKYEASFRTWAFSWISGTIRRSLLREGTIRLPLKKAAAIKRMEAVSDDLYYQLGREPSLREIAEKMGRTEQDVCDLIVLQAQSQEVRLHTPLDDDGKTSPEDVLVDVSVSGFVDDDFSSVEDILKHLTESERAVLLLRCGFGYDRAYTQNEVAQILGMRLHKVQMLDRRARIRLRKVLQSSPA
jgi:RNA polymerase primary sigma factor